MREAVLWRVAVYIRLSREDGRAESESVQNQRDILSAYLAELPGAVLAGCYIDDGLSGTDDTRAAFARMIEDIEAGQVNCVLCKTLSRAFRNYADQGYYLEYYFPRKNVRFISTGDPKMDTYLQPEALTGLEVPITGLMNDRFAAKTSGDVRRTFDHKRRCGKFIGAFAPYGYQKDPADKNHLVLDEDVLPIKREILRWFTCEGMSLMGIAKRLNALGIPNPTAYKRSLGLQYHNPGCADGLWSGSSVRRVLTDPVNLGHMVQGKQRVVSYKVHDRVAAPPDEWFIKENTHAPSFTQGEYDAVQRLLARSPRTPKGSPVQLFSGFLRCADCRKALHRKSANGLVYYACRTYTEQSNTRCSKHSLREDRLAAALLPALQALIALSGCLPTLLRALPECTAPSGLGERQLLEQQRKLEQVRQLSDGLYADWKSGLMSQETYLRRCVKFDEQEARLSAALAQAEHPATPPEDPLAPLRQAQTLPSLDRALLSALVEVVLVHENQSVTIHFLCKDVLKPA